MNREEQINFLKFLHNLEKTEREKGLFKTDAGATAEKIRKEFLLNIHSKNRG